MMPISRRAFIQAGSLAMVSLGADPLFLDRAAYALGDLRRGLAGKKTLVCLFQRGAVDGLSMIVPAGDQWYWQERQRIALPREQLISLDGMFALHPRLAALKPLWEQRALAIVHAVGSPSTTRSHFDAQDYMESGTPDRKSTPDGWANRYCSHAREHTETPFRAVAFGPQLPRTLAGSAPALAIDDLRTFGMRASRAEGEQRLTRAFESLYEGAATGLVASSSAEGFEAIKMLKAANPTGLAPANGAQYPRGKLGQSMQQIAQLIKADLGMQVAFADVGGWDTHVNQGADQGQLATRLDELGGALGAFTADLGEKMRDVVVVTMSEFGRTVKENGTGGTDHGHGTAMMVIGGDVRGGKVYGRWPTLAPEARYEGRDLAVTTDFRAVFGEVLTGHLGGADLAAVFPGFEGTGGVGLFG
ncbi:MAG: DUF1501 domain-containing protein [Gemmatimonadota bacterium]